MKTAREQAVDCASNIYDILIEWGVSMPRDIRGDVQEEVINLVTAALEEKEREIERLRLLAAKNNSEAQRYLNALTTECRSDVETRQQLAEAVKLLEPFAKEVAYKPHHCAAFPDEASPNFVTLGHCRAAAAFVAKHTHTEKPDGKLQKPLDTHAKPL